MTDRIKGLTVVLDRDYRTDDVDAIVNAILMVRGVARVEKSVANYEDYMNRSRVHDVLAKRIWDALNSKDIKYD